jgi:hypothetical protein
MAAAIQKIIHCWCDLPVKSFILFGADSKNSLWKILQTCVGTVSVPMVILHTSKCVLCYTASKPRAGCPCSKDFNVEKKAASLKILHTFWKTAKVELTELHKVVKSTRYLYKIFAPVDP